MAISELMTSWAEHDAAILRLLPLARREIAVFDRDLSVFRFEERERHEALARLLRNAPGASLRIALRNAEPAQRQFPRLMNLLRLFAHNFQLVETPPHLANLSDSMLLIDGDNALIRFHQDHARSREIRDDAEACQPYRKRFEEIWNDGCIPIGPTALGL